MRRNILGHGAGGNVSTLGQRETYQRQQHGRQVAGHDAQKAVEVKPPGFRDWGALQRLPRIGQIEQKAAEQDHPVHKQVARTGEEVKIRRQSQQAHALGKPALLPDVVVHHRQHHQRPKSVEHANFQLAGRRAAARMGGVIRPRHSRPP